MSLNLTDDKSELVQVITWASVDPDLCRCQGRADIFLSAKVKHVNFW